MGEPEADADATVLYSSHFGHAGYYGLGYRGYYGHGYGYGLGAYRYGGYPYAHHYGYGHYLGKRSADAEPEADAAADAYYGYYGRGYYGYPGYGYGYGRYYG